MLTNYLGDRSFWRVTLRLAIPIALQNLLISSFSLVDTIMVGQLGDISLSAVGMASQWTWLLNIAMFGIISGVSIFTAQYWGIQDFKGIRRVYGIGLLTLLVMSILFMAVGFTWTSQVMYSFNRDAAVVREGSAYLRIAVFSYPAMALSGVFSVILRSTEKVKLPLFVSLISTVLNGVLNYALIFGALGMPEMKVEGAAVATVISAWVGPVIYILASALQKNILIAPLRDMLAIGRKDIRDFFRKAIPVLLNEVLWGVGTFCFNVLFSNLGYENYAALTILRTFENIVFAFSIGLCNACCVMLGKSIGEGKTERAAGDAKRFTFLVPLISIVLGVFIILGRALMVRLFNLTGNITPYTVMTAQWLMVVYAIEMPMRMIPYIEIVGIFRSGGDTKRGLLYDMVCLYGLSLPLTLVAAHVLHLPFIWVFAVAYAAEDILKAVLCIRYMFSYRWIKPITEQGKLGLQRFLEARANEDKLIEQN